MHRLALAIDAKLRKDLGLEEFNPESAYMLTPEDVRKIQEKLKIAVMDD